MSRGEILRRALVVGSVTIPVALAIGINVPLCPMAAIFGLPCPGCGLTRATLAALHGDFASALHFHPLVFWVAPVYVFLVTGLLWSYVRGTPPLPATSPPTPAAGQRDFMTSAMLGRATSVLAGITIALLLAVWIARFCGLFGGPVPVESLEQWREHHSR